MKNFLKSAVIAVITFEARAALRRHKPKIIAVTGNVGKTSTKDAIFAVVSGAFETRRSEKSLNSEIGLPLAILNLETAWSSASGWLRNIKKGARAAWGRGRFPEWLVLEVGADHPGDIEKVTRWLRPDIVVLTRMSDTPVHVEFFKDAEEVLKEKMFLARALKPGGTLIVNADDPHFTKAVQEIESKKIFYGTGKQADVEIAETEVMYDGTPLSLPIGQYALMRIGKERTRIEFKSVLGSHLMYPAAAACAVALALGIEPVVADAFEHFESPKGRMRILKGRENSVIVDDTYNSSPLACAAAIKAVEKLSVRGRKFAALGDMKELGENSERAHREIGALAAEGLYGLVTVGEMSEFTTESARRSGMPADRIFHFDDSVSAGEALSHMIRAGDVVLVKGSQSMRMERVSKALLADPGQAKKLLVRQEEEWLKR